MVGYGMWYGMICGMARRSHSHVEDPFAVEVQFTHKSPRSYVELPFTRGRPVHMSCPVHTPEVHEPVRSGEAPFKRMGPVQTWITCSRIEDHSRTRSQVCVPFTDVQFVLVCTLNSHVHIPIHRWHSVHSCTLAYVHVYKPFTGAVQMFTANQTITYFAVIPKSSVQNGRCLHIR